LLCNHFIITFKTFLYFLIKKRLKDTLGTLSALLYIPIREEYVFFYYIYMQKTHVRFYRPSEKIKKNAANAPNASNTYLDLDQ